AAGADGTEGARQVTVGLAAHEAAAGAERVARSVAGRGRGVAVGAVTGFQLEGRLQAAAEIFDALEADARTARHAGVEANRLASGAAAIHGQAQVDLAVEGDRRLGESGAGHGGEHCESEQRLFHCEYLLGLTRDSGRGAAGRVSPQG